MGNKQSNKASTMLVSIIAVLSITVGVLGYHVYDLKNEIQQETHNSKATKTDLEITYNKLDKISLRLETQILEIQKLGGEVDSLLEIKKQLEHDKYQLQLSKNITLKRYKEIENTIENYQQLVERKDSEIAILKSENQRLSEEYATLQDSTVTLSGELNSLKDANENLSSKVASAKLLQAIDFKLVAISKNGKERLGHEHKVRYIDKLRIHFNIADNGLADVGGRKLYLRIIEPDGKVLFNISTGSGKFRRKGKEEFYTIMQEILFDNSEQLVTYLYVKGNNFKRGKHRIEVFCDENLMGKTSFKVK